MQKPPFKAEKVLCEDEHPPGPGGARREKRLYEALTKTKVGCGPFTRKGEKEDSFPEGLKTQRKKKKPKRTIGKEKGEKGGGEKEGGAQDHRGV